MLVCGCWCVFVGVFLCVFVVRACVWIVCLFFFGCVRLRLYLDVSVGSCVCRFWVCLGLFFLYAHGKEKKKSLS